MPRMKDHHQAAPTGGMLQDRPDMSKAVKTGCPVCRYYTPVCELCDGKKWVWALPGGALFPPEARAPKY